jgi:hypothetical protein
MVFTLQEKIFIVESYFTNRVINVYGLLCIQMILMRWKSLQLNFRCIVDGISNETFLKKVFDNVISHEHMCANQQ